ncbi:50S ribosomal protein L4 [Geovibrio ferrireducens]|jgi:large subunit ribosomal protein L4|uniref:50S ribosomal protein L4 n=1 Tax=Geovibrio ferrireducens TaxID=46201 RepID=UPI002245EB2B|nr:50S ribosomal protein L4 [Geovibrio ferrireducens]
MASFELVNVKNEKVGTVEINDSIITYPVKTSLMHEVVVMQLAGKRAGTHATLNRAKIEGGGKKPYKQKGTGRARAGSIKSPLWRGGATIFGPQPRDYSFSMPKKKIKNAMKSALRAKHEDGSLVFVDALKLEEGKTKEAVAILKNFNADRKVLVVFKELDEKVARAFRNIPYVDLLNVNGLNVYDIINSRKILVLQDSIARIEEVLG